MSIKSRPYDFESRGGHLRAMTDDQLHRHFWSLVAQITAPLIEEAHSHTSPSIERSVLLRMGFSSIEAKALVLGFAERDLLPHGAGHLILELAKHRGISVRQAGQLLLEGRDWEALRP